MSNQEKLQSILESFFLHRRIGNPVLDYLLLAFIDHCNKTCRISGRNLKLEAEDYLEIIDRLNIALDMELFTEEDITKAYEMVHESNKPVC